MDKNKWPLVGSGPVAATVVPQEALGNIRCAAFIQPLVLKGIKNVDVVHSWKSGWHKIKRPKSFNLGLCSSGNRTRTCDLRVMSPTSYQLLHPAIYLFIYLNSHTQY